VAKGKCILTLGIATNSDCGARSASVGTNGRNSFADFLYYNKKTFWQILICAKTEEEADVVSSVQISNSNLSTHLPDNF
jgi:hypothetical protein